MRKKFTVKESSLILSIICILISVAYSMGTNQSSNKNTKEIESVTLEDKISIEVLTTKNISRGTDVTILEIIDKRPIAQQPTTIVIVDTTKGVAILKIR